VQRLLDNLTQIGKPPVPLAFPDGTRLLVLPFGGRLLGLFPPGPAENFLWTNPALATRESTAAWSSRVGWPNSGGDRTWLAPEIDLFFGDLNRSWETYAVPPALDPGYWTLSSATATELCLTNSTRLWLHRSGCAINVRLCKSYRAAVNPLARSGLQYAGYTQVTTLELESGTNVPLGIWNLLQLPQGGTLLIPTRTATRPQLVFGKSAADELTVATGLVRWNMAVTGQDTKIAIKAQSLTGRAGYLHETATLGIWDLVVREFAVDPGGHYVDALWEPPHENGWCFQACCVRNGPAKFNELEYHAPVGCRQDESHVWAFRGPANLIAEAAVKLLGAEVDPILYDPQTPHGDNLTTERTLL